jgi:hypothetical protein
MVGLDETYNFEVIKFFFWGHLVGGKYFAFKKKIGERIFRCWWQQHPHLIIISRCKWHQHPYLELIFRCGCWCHPHLEIPPHCYPFRGLGPFTGNTRRGRWQTAKISHAPPPSLLRPLSLALPPCGPLRRPVCALPLQARARPRPTVLRRHPVAPPQWGASSLLRRRLHSSPQSAHTPPSPTWPHLPPRVLPWVRGVPGPCPPLYASLAHAPPVGPRLHQSPPPPPVASSPDSTSSIYDPRHQTPRTVALVCWDMVVFMPNFSCGQMHGVYVSLWNVKMMWGIRSLI